MSDPSAIRLDPNASFARSWTSSFALPADLVDQARRRLGLLALASGVMTLFFGPLSIFLTPNEGFEHVFAINVALSLAASFALYFATRWSRLGNALVLMMGQLYEVLWCLSCATVLVWDVYHSSGQPPPVTFGCVLIVLFPAIVPTTPRLTLATSWIAAAMSPLGLGILYWLGTIPEPPLVHYAIVFTAPWATGVFAYIGSRVTHDMGVELARARELGSYTLEEMLGRGGMGEVWKARHQMLSRPAAIKLIKSQEAGDDAHAANPTQIARFEREVQLTTRLSHPNTITIYDYGRSRDGTFYYVMELLDGASLDTIVELVGPQRPERVGHIISQVLGALEEAHGIGLIHRDIKPANIMLCVQGGRQDVAKLLDFGLVKDIVTDDDVHLTSDGTISGTPLYLAPESISKPNHSDVRSDIYSLGAVVYFLLTGEHVFLGESLVEVCAHHLHATPVSPSERLGAALPADLEQLVLDCLAKDPDARPQSATEMLARLQECSLEEWSTKHATEWWDEYAGALESPEVTDAPSARTIDIDPRLD